MAYNLKKLQQILLPYMDFEIISRTICCTPDSSQNVLRFRKFLKASAWRKVTSRLSTGNSSDVSDDDDDDLRGLLQMIEKGSRLNIPKVCTAAAVYECYIIISQ